LATRAFARLAKIKEARVKADASFASAQIRHADKLRTLATEEDEARKTLDGFGLSVGSKGEEDAG